MSDVRRIEGAAEHREALHERGSSALLALESLALARRALRHRLPRILRFDLAEGVDRFVPMTLARVRQRQSQLGFGHRTRVAVFVEHAVEVDARRLPEPQLEV